MNEVWLSHAGPLPVIQSPCPYFKHEMIDESLPPAGVLHTTEGGWSGSMDVFKVHYAPHFIVGLNGAGKPEIAQLVPLGGVIAAAIVTHNKFFRCQIEFVGFAKETPWLPAQPALDALCHLLNAVYDGEGIPLTHPWPDGDYGRAGDNPHRNSGKAGTVAGWFGHADCPWPDSHWDPGNLQWSKLFARCAELAAMA